MFESLWDGIIDAAATPEARARRLALGAAKDDVLSARAAAEISRAQADELLSAVRRLIAATDEALIASGDLPY